MVHYLLFGNNALEYELQPSLYHLFYRYTFFLYKLVVREMSHKVFKLFNYIFFISLHLPRIGDRAKD